MTTKQKLYVCAAATMTILSGGVMLPVATQAQTAPPNVCSAAQMSYAQGYADGACIADGATYGRVTSCGGGEFTFVCVTRVGDD